MKKSCGVIITDGKVLLAIKPWGKRGKLDIPKGGMDEGETEIQTALRELKEETGLEASKNQLKDLGLFDYTREKQLHLFLLKTRRLPPISMMKCNSYFTNDWGKRVPEATGFEYVAFEDQRFYYNLKRLLGIVQKHV